MSNNIPEPAESLTDNLVGDIVDSLLTGVGANLLVSLLFGKSPSFKNIMNLDMLKDGVKLGGAIGVYRRVARPMVNNVMNRSGMESLMKI